MSDPKVAGFLAESIQLLECEFKANPAVLSGDVQKLTPPEFEFAFKSRILRDKRLIMTTGVVVGKDPAGDKAAVTLKVKMRVIFSWQGDVSMPVKEFAAHNSTAFLWPYLREMIWNFTVRSELPALILPVLNFRVADIEVVEVPAGATRASGGDSTKSGAGQKRF